MIEKSADCQQTNISLADAEKIIHSGGANHFKNCEAVGGRLYLLADRLYFCSHKFNLQNHELTIPLAQIKTVEFYNVFGLVPNGLKVTMPDGKKEKFVVSKRRLWKEKISEAAGLCCC